MISRRIAVFFILITVSIGLGCTKNNGTSSGRNPCLEPRKYFITVQSVRQSDTGSAGDVINLPSPVVGYVDTNILFYDDTVAGSTFIGPLSAVADSTRWFIIPDTLNTAIVDTLTFFYERKPVFLSTACGYTFIFSLNNVSVTNNAIDSARIENFEINGEADLIHVKIFY